MHLDDDLLTFSATDLSTYSACSHATLLDREAARGERKKPHRNDPAIQLLQERGRQHEDSYRKLLEERHGRPVHDIGAKGLRTAAEWEAASKKTLAAMKEGHPVLYQAAIAQGLWHGYVDFLVRVDHEPDAPPSLLGSFHYAAVDTKLSQETRGAALIQLCVYSVILESLQGLLPEMMTVVSPAGMVLPGQDPSPKEHRFATVDFGAYFRRLRSQMETYAQRESLDESYPEPCSHCDVCSWWDECNTRRRADDHLSFVAGLSRQHRKLLAAAGVETLQSLGKLSLPMGDRPKKLPGDLLERIHHQARLQLEARETGKPRYEMLPVEPGRGLCLLPEPSPGDIFFDIEADRFAPDGTLHYLFGWVEVSKDGSLNYTEIWAHNRAQERAAFEHFIDHVVAKRGQQQQEDPALHVYHFAPFEKTALGEMSLRYLSREEEVDDMLRNGVLCDLMPAVKQSLRAGVESYSIKEMEQFYNYSRKTELRAASRARRLYEINRESGTAQSIPEVIETITNYNREDCESALRLRDFLEAERARALSVGADIPRPELKQEPPSDDKKAWAKRVEHLRSRLLKDMPDDLVQVPENERDGWKSRKLLADIVDWHNREHKPAWWEFFRALGLSPEEAQDDSAPIGGVYGERACGKSDRPKARVHRYEYSFPPQDYSLKKGDTAVFSPDGTSDSQVSLGTVVEIDRVRNVIAIERMPNKVDGSGATMLVKDGSPPGVETLRNSLAEIAESLAPDFGLPARLIDEWDAGDRAFGSARALLSRAAPTLKDGSPLQKSGETSAQALKRIGPLLKQTVLPVQGPPGSGKTYSGSDMIVELVRRGKKVGITAQSHKVIANLLEGVHEAVARAREAGTPVQFMSGQKVSDKEDLIERPENLNYEGVKASKIASALEQGEVNVVGGTSWLWTSVELRNSVDVLVIDEAGQFSLANALAVSVAADSLVLLGDPQQLAQPSQGSHPAGAEASALQHLLGDSPTVAEGKGLFLESTWRLPPNVTDFTSQYFYGGRLKSHPDCAERTLKPGTAAKEYAGTGLFFVPVEHENNVNHCDEEAAKILELCQSLLDAKTSWIDREGKEKPLEQKEILVVAPYNSQVHAVEETLVTAGLDKVRVGTVDKFQGQEAPVVIYSMTTSNPEDAPRGFDFLYSRNRLNVATSRSEAIVIVVSSPRLLEADCRTPAQMRLVNALCGAAEIAEGQHPSSPKKPA